MYTNNKLSEREAKKNIPFTTTTRKIKYLGINLTKDIRYLYSENTEHGRKKLGKIQINGSIHHVHGLEELTSLKCPHYPTQSIDSMQFLLKYQWPILQT